MYFKFHSHNTDNGTSCGDYVNYLEKENLENEKERNTEEENHLYRNSKFFNSDKDIDNNFIPFHKDKVIEDIDNNLASRIKNEANFYKLDVAPSYKELLHIQKIAEEELKNRGIEKGNDDFSKANYEVHKNELIEQQLKEYTSDVMKQYAESFNRDIYVNEDKLPNKQEKKEILSDTEKIYNEAFLKDNFNELYKEKKEQSKIETYSNFSDIKQEEKTITAKIKLDNKQYDVEIPKGLVLNAKDEKGNFKFENNEVKLPENFYKEKIEDLRKRDNTIELNHTFKEEKVSKKNDKGYLIFSAEHKNLTNKFDIVIDKKDVQKVDGKYLINEKLLELKYKTALKQAVEKEYPNLKTDIYEKIATIRGFDMSKRPLTEKDLLWYAKVEKNRTWKIDDSPVIKNDAILNEMKNTTSKSKLAELDKQLERDKSGKVIVKGLKKEGLNYHVHVIVSRHDKLMKNPENKISLSPLANAKDGNNIGFNRKEFMLKNIDTFDKKFEYNRSKEERYLEKTNQKGLLEKKLENQVNQKTEREVKKITGLDEVQKELKFVNISLTHRPSLSIQPIKQQIGLNDLPNIKLSTVITNPKKAIIDLAVNTAKKIIGLDGGY